MTGGSTNLGQSNLTLSDIARSPSMLLDTLRNLVAGWSGSSWNLPVTQMK